MYPIKHPFIYEGEVKLTAKLFHCQRCGQRLGENFDNAFSRHHNDEVKENTATETRLKRISRSIVLRYLFSLLSQTPRGAENSRKLKRKRMFRKSPENVRRWILLVETAFVVVRMENIAQRNSKN